MTRPRSTWLASFKAALHRVGRVTRPAPAPAPGPPLPLRTLEIDHLSCTVRIDRRDVAYQDLLWLITKIPGRRELDELPGDWNGSLWTMELTPETIPAARAFFIPFYAPAELPQELQSALNLELVSELSDPPPKFLNIRPAKTGKRGENN